MSPDFLKPDETKLHKVLQGVNFLSLLKPEELEQLAGAMIRRSYPKGATVIKEGGKGYTFFVVISGRLSVWVKKGEGSAQIDTRMPDQFFGEMALVSNEPRMATIKVEEDCELYELSKDDFQKILMANPKIAESVTAEIAKRKAKSA